MAFSNKESELVDQLTTFSDGISADPMLYQLGIQHDAFTYKFQGLDAKLTGVEGGKPIKAILA